MVLVGKRCRAGSATIGRISVISCGVRPRAALALRASLHCGLFNSGMGTRWVIGQCAMGATVMQAEPCRIMARVSGPRMLGLVVRAVGTSGQSPR